MRIYFLGSVSCCGVVGSGFLLVHLVVRVSVGKDQGVVGRFE